MNFTDTTLFKLSNLFGKTEVTLLLLKDDLEKVTDEMDSVMKYDTITANAHASFEATIASQLGMKRYTINNTNINMCDRDKFIEIFLTEPKS